MYDRGESQFQALKGKGADIKHLVFAMEHAFAEFMCATNLQHKTIRSMLGQLVQIEELFHEHKDLYALPDSAAKKMSLLADSFAERLTSLFNHFHSRGIVLFHYTIKMHYFQHLGLVSSYLHPRLGSCYRGEDILGKFKAVIQSCQMGTAPGDVERKAILKYAQGFSMTFLNKSKRLK